MSIGHHVRKAEAAKRATEEPITVEEAQAIEVPQAASPLPPGFDMAQFAQMLGLAIKEGTAGAIEQAKPRVHSREDWEYEKVSAYNRAGERARPRPGLKVPMYFGVFNDVDPTRPPIPLYEIESQQTTYDEQLLLNQLVESRGDLEMNDGTTVPYEVYVQKDRITHQPIKLILALPKERYEKQLRGTLPTLKRMVTELLQKQEQAA